MAVSISWTKSYSASNDGDVLGGADLGNLQSDIEGHTHSGVPSSYTVSFVSGNLAAGVLTVSHSLGIQYVCYAIYDNNGKNIIPDEATATNTNTLTIDLSSYSVNATVTGTWNIRVMA